MSAPTSILKENAEHFLSIAHEFKLGKLLTKSPHPKTKKLSELAKNNLAEGFDLFKDIDTYTLNQILDHEEELKELKKSIKETIDSGSRIYLCGCGATGRLSLSLETFWRENFKNQKKLREKVVSFMAGGDVALIHSIEKFEDFPEFGERQLRENHFFENDLLISCTEGGETPFVIGATQYAAKFSKRNPYFLYCNPDETLKEVATRSKDVLENKNIKKINLTVGQMALTGSTRLQASTILRAFVGFAMMYHHETDEVMMSEIKKLIEFQKNFQYSLLSNFTKEEATHYQNGGTILYDTESFWGITILTDTTERSPTFSLYSFENQNDSDKKPSLVYLFFSKARDSKEAWEMLLKRSPRTFYWAEVTKQTSNERLAGFQFHGNLINLREKYLEHKDELFTIFGQESVLFKFKSNELKIDLSSLDLLSKHLVMKMLLNAHSTLLMGRLNRYEGNLMTWVRPSNYKLIDRSVRYVDILLKEKGMNISYEKLVHDCYELKDQISRNEAIVLKIIEKNLESKT